MNLSLNSFGSFIQLENGSNYSTSSFNSVEGSFVALGTGSQSSTLNLSGSGTSTINAAITMADSQGLGLGNLLVSGSGTRVLGGGNGYTGTTTINGGTLQIASGSLTEVLPDRTDVTLANAAGAQLDLNGKNETIGSLAGGGTTGGNIALGSGTLTTGTNGLSTSFAGVISGLGGLTKVGNGTLNLSGATTITGSVNVRSGALTLSRVGGGTLANTTNVSLSGGSLNVNTSNTIADLSATSNSTINLGTGATLTTSATAGSTVRDVKTSSALPILNIPSGTEGLKVGMSVRDLDAPSELDQGAYIVQILSATQVLISTIPSQSTTNTPLDTVKCYSFGSVSQVAASLKGDGTLVKNGSGDLLLGGGNSDMTGTLVFNGGTITAGGFNYAGRNIIQGTISDAASVVLGSTDAVNLNLASSRPLNLLPFERIGSLAGGGSNAVVNLSDLTSRGALAVGGNNLSTNYSGSIRGAAGSFLIKEGTGTFTWTNDDALATDATIRVDNGRMQVDGSVGLRPNSNVVLSNASGAKLGLSTTDVLGEEIAFISGGGRGASRPFLNGVQGALLGNYLVGGSSEIEISTRLTLSSSAAGQLYTYGGNITGTGDLEKKGNNTLLLLGNSTYSGETVIKSDISNTTSILSIGAYSASAGAGAVGSGGYGSLPSTTRLKMISGTSGLTNANVQFDLNGSTQTLSALSVQNTNGTQIINLGGGTININTVSGQLNGFFGGMFNGRGTINVLATQGNGWFIDGSIIPGNSAINNNTTHTGSFNIAGGRVVLSGPSGSLGDTVHTSISSGATLNVSVSDKIGSLRGGGSLELPGTTLTVTSAPEGPINDNSWSGIASGSGNLILSETARMRITANQTFTGRLTVKDSAQLILDYSNGTTNNIISGLLTLAGASVRIQGGTSAIVDSVVGGSRLESGLTTISGAPSGAMLGLGSMTRISGGILEVLGAPVGIANDAENGILGGYATYGASRNITTWAVPNGSTSPIQGLPDSAYVNSIGSASLDSNFDVVSNLSNWDQDVNTLRFNTNTGGNTIEAIISGDSRILTSGGILVTKAVGAQEIRIKNEGTDDVLTLSGGDSSAVGNELIIHQHNTLGNLFIEVPIINNPNFGAQPLNFTKTGQGKVILTGLNSFSGATNISAGVLQLGDGGSKGSVGDGVIRNNGHLFLDHGGFGGTIGSNIHGVGGITVSSQGGEETFNGTFSSFTGTVNVKSGTLVAGASSSDGVTGSLGSARGLTAVAGQGTLKVQSGFLTAETILLSGGGDLFTSTGGATLLGPVLISENGSSIGSADDGAALRLAGPIINQPGTDIAFNGGGIGASFAGRIIIANSNSQLGKITLGSTGKQTRLYIGAGHNSTAAGTGSLGRSDVDNRGVIVVNVSDNHYVLGSLISGTGGLTINRNNVYLTRDNTFSGPTLVGGNGSGVAGISGGDTLNSAAELRVGNDGYSGSLGSGNLIIQSSTAASSVVRFSSLRNQVVPNNITLNPWSDGVTARNAFLVSQGLGSINLTGTITAGSHDASNRAPNTQRAVIQYNQGGKMTLSGTLITGEGNRLDFQPVGSPVLEIAGSADNEIWGRFLSGSGATVFSNSGTTTLRGFNNFAGANVYIQKGTLSINHEIVLNSGGGVDFDSDPDPSNATT
ncbi:MAG: autotransporter-associated beta strand repeat-containing protein, partial [Verrucomicrobia bacterium]|nr:autotransporter-associated beta strand repeat-containing protein [Verrucomicrobiota bacterium]